MFYTRFEQPCINIVQNIYKLIKCLFKYFLDKFCINGESMRYNTVLNALQNLTKEEIRQADIVKASGLIRSTVNYRCINNGDFNSTEINKIEQYYSKIYNKDVKLSDYICTDIGQSQEELAEVDYYENIEVSCGSGICSLNETKKKLLLPKNLITNYANYKKYSVVRAVSDSMTPYIQPKDYLIIEDTKEIENNQVYVFLFGETLYCKNLSNNINQILIRSYNSDYPTRYIEGEDLNKLHIIGKVVGLIRNME